MTPTTAAPPVPTDSLTPEVPAAEENDRAVYDDMLWLIEMLEAGGYEEHAGKTLVVAEKEILAQSLDGRTARLEGRAAAERRGIPKSRLITYTLAGPETEWSV